MSAGSRRGAEPGLLLTIPGARARPLAQDHPPDDRARRATCAEAGRQNRSAAPTPMPAGPPARLEV